MKKTILSLCALMLLALSACNNEIETPATDTQKAVTGRPMTIEVSRGDASTKINVYKDNMSLTWSDKDSLSVVFKDAEGNLVNEKFVLKDGIGETSAIFECQSSQLPDLSDGKTVDVAVFYPYKEPDTEQGIVYSTDISQQNALTEELGEFLSLAGTAKVKNEKMSGCNLDPQFVVLKLAKGTKLFDSDSNIGQIDDIMIEDLNGTICSGQTLDTDGEIETQTTAVTVKGPIYVTDGKLDSDVYAIFIDDTMEGDATTPNIRIMVSAEGDDFTYVVTRSKAFNAGSIYSMPITADSQYIDFADPNVKSALLTKLGKESTDEITYAEAAAVNELGDIFKWDSEITSFDELQYFTKVTKIDSWAFDYCTKLTSITLPNGVTSIGEYAFDNCTALTSVNIPETVTSIGVHAFEDCTSLTSINIPDGVTTISNGTFESCTSLASVTLPEGLETIDSWAFYSCTSLTTITLPDGLTSIGSSAFDSCTSLTSITLPDGLETINGSAFQDCTSLASITIPIAVTSIGENVFDGCTSLTAINVVEGNESYCSQDGVLFNKAMTTLIRYPQGKEDTSYTVPGSVTTIDKHAFIYCTNLTDVTLPEGLESIGDNAFSECGSLAAVTCKATTPPTLGVNVFAQSNSATIYVPEGLVSTYQGADGWSSYSSKISALPTK